MNKIKVLIMLVLSLTLSISIYPPVYADTEVTDLSTSYDIKELFKNESIEIAVRKELSLSPNETVVTQRQLDTIESLFIRENNTDIQSFKEFSSLKNLELLVLRGSSNIKDFQHIELLPKLKDLVLTEPDLISFEGIEKGSLDSLEVIAPNPQILNLGESMLEPIGKSNITRLTLNNAGIENTHIKALKNNQSLSSINVSNLQPRDVNSVGTPIRERLVINGDEAMANKISAFEPFKVLSKLKSLNITDNPVRDLNGLDAYTNPYISLDIDAEGYSSNKFNPNLPQINDFSSVILDNGSGIGFTINHAYKIQQNPILTYDEMTDEIVLNLDYITPPKSYDSKTKTMKSSLIAPERDADLISNSNSFGDISPDNQRYIYDDNNSLTSIRWNRESLTSFLNHETPELLQILHFRLYDEETPNGPQAFQILIFATLPEINGSDVTVHYIDTNNNPIADSITLSGRNKLGQGYTTLKQTFEFYDFISATNNTRGVFTKEPQEVIYKYERKDAAPVIANHFDTAGEPLAESTMLDGSGKYGLGYTTQAIDIESHDLIEIPINATGTFTKDIQFVNYIYARKSAGDIIVNYVDTDGIKLVDSNLLSGESKLGLPYTTTSRDIQNYELKDIPSNASGYFSIETQTVTYVYSRKNAGNVTVNHVDELGNKLVSSETIDGGHQLGNPYTTSPASITNYELFKTPDNATGSFTIEERIVTYTYVRKSAGNVIVKHLDDEGHEIIEPEFISGLNKYGLSYETSAMKDESYDLVSVTDNAKGFFALEDQVVIYTYSKPVVLGVKKKPKEEINKPLISKETPIEVPSNNLPATGVAPSYIGYGSVLLGSVLFVVKSMKRKEN
ncbi:MAG: MucBP domain-containing protein [Erysipelothrix sp.]